MTEAVIVSTARTPLCKSWRGALNMTHGAKMGGHVVQAALERAKVSPEEVEDVLMGCANPEGATGHAVPTRRCMRWLKVSNTPASAASAAAAARLPASTPAVRSRLPV